MPSLAQPKPTTCKNDWGLFLWGDLLGESSSAAFLRPRLSGLLDLLPRIEARHFWPRKQEEPWDGDPIPLSGGREGWTVRSRLSPSELARVEGLVQQCVPLGSPVLAVARPNEDPTPLIHADIPEAGRIFLVDPDTYPHDGRALATEILQTLEQEGHPPFSLNLVIPGPEEGGSPELQEEGRRFQALFGGDSHGAGASPPGDSGENPPAIRPRVDLHFVKPERFHPLPGARLSILRILDPRLPLGPEAQEALRLPHQVWVPSGFGRRILERMGVPPAKIRCVPPPLPPSRFWDSPSLGDTHPLALIEAMAKGLPPWVAPFGTVQDLVEHEGNANLLPGRCLHRASDETTWLSPAGPGLRTASRTQATRHARSHFAPGRVRTLALEAVDGALKPRHAPPGPLIRLEGPLFESSSYGRITRSFARALRRRCPSLPIELHSRLDALSDAERDADLLPLCVPSGRRASHCIRSGWPVSFRVPDHGEWILRFDWEFGPPPLSLAGLFSGPVGSPHAPNQIWVHSSYVKDNLLAAGIPPERLRLVPHGIDPELFHPRDLPRRSPKTTFLFVGGFTRRKGLDLLLQAWQQAFGPGDPVRLLLKTSPTSAYSANPMAIFAREASQDPRLAEVILLNDDLDDPGMARLYQEADILVHPYRGEGFGMPILEAMACGLPVITTAGGASEDFVEDLGSITISARKVPCRIKEPCAGKPFWLEPELGELTGALVLAAQGLTALKREAQEISLEVRERHSWDAVVQRTLPLLGLASELDP